MRTHRTAVASRNVISEILLLCNYFSCKAVPPKSSITFQTVFSAGEKCSNSWAHGGHFLFKSQQCQNNCPNNVRNTYSFCFGISNPKSRPYSFAWSLWLVCRLQPFLPCACLAVSAPERAGLVSYGLSSLCIFSNDFRANHFALDKQLGGGDCFPGEASFSHFQYFLVACLFRSHECFLFYVSPSLGVFIVA